VLDGYDSWHYCVKQIDLKGRLGQKNVYFSEKNKSNNAQI